LPTIAQIIAYTFVLNCVTLDAPGAYAIISSKKYQAHLALLQQKYPNAFNDVGCTPDTGENFSIIVPFAQCRLINFYLNVSTFAKTITSHRA
jgi:hypothetical protein